MNTCKNCLSTSQWTSFPYFNNTLSVLYLIGFIAAMFLVQSLTAADVEAKELTVDTTSVQPTAAHPMPPSYITACYWVETIRLSLDGKTEQTGRREGWYKAPNLVRVENVGSLPFDPLSSRSKIRENLDELEPIYYGEFFFSPRWFIDAYRSLGAKVSITVSNSEYEGNRYQTIEMNSKPFVTTEGQKLGSYRMTEYLDPSTKRLIVMQDEADDQSGKWVRERRTFKYEYPQTISDDIFIYTPTADASVVYAGAEQQNRTSATHYITKGSVTSREGTNPISMEAWFKQPNKRRIEFPGYYDILNGSYYVSYDKEQNTYREETRDIARYTDERYTTEYVINKLREKYHDGIQATDGTAVYLGVTYKTIDIQIPVSLNDNGKQVGRLHVQLFIDPKTGLIKVEKNEQWDALNTKFVKQDETVYDYPDDMSDSIFKFVPPPDAKVQTGK